MWLENILPHGHLWAGVHKIEYSSQKYENSELDWETQFLFHFILLNKFNRTEIQTYKVEERTFGTPFTGVMLKPTEL